MKTVQVESAQLLDTLQTNRTKHIAEYNEAVIEHRKDVISALEEQLAEIKAGGKIKYSIDLPVPSSYESTYNTVIKMLEFSTETIVELTMAEFQQYVEDNWSWKSAFVGTNAFYNNKKL